MYICVCKAVSARTARRAIQEHGIVTLRELVRHTGLGTCCGTCVPAARELLQRETEVAPVPRGGPLFGGLGEAAAA